MHRRIRNERFPAHNKIKRRIIWGIAALALLVAFLFFFQKLLTPKYMTTVYEGRLIGEYYAQNKSHDVLIIGDCEVYENISPMTLWENFGITSYIRGSPQQLVWQSYYLLEDALRYETPKIVVFSVLSMMYNEPQSEAYNRLTLDGMRLSASKLSAIRASMTEGEQWITYILPILRYHDRWRELSGDDLRYLFGAESVSHNGFMMRCDARPATVFPIGIRLPDYRFGSVSYEYLDKITALCAANGIELVLYKSPSIYPYWYDEWDEQMVEYAQEHNIRYINTLEVLEEVGIDWDTDTYDGGLHLNLFGAEKMSFYLGNYLLDNFSLPDRRSDALLREAWEKKRLAYYGMMERQLHELEISGAISTFTYTG